MGGGGGGGGIKWGGTHYLARIYFRIDLLNLFGFFCWCWLCRAEVFGSESTRKRKDKEGGCLATLDAARNLGPASKGQREIPPTMAGRGQPAGRWLRRR